MLTPHRSLLVLPILPVFAIYAAVTSSACRPHPATSDAGATPLAPVPSASLDAAAPSASVSRPTSAPNTRRAIAPRPGTVTHVARPVLRVTPGVDAVELCRTRACDAPQRVAVGADGRATPASELQAGTWFWRVAARDASPPGPLWSLTVRKGAGLSTRAHGFDANGDGLDDVLVEASVLFGAPGAAGLAERFTPVRYAKLDGTSAKREPTPTRTIRISLMVPAGDIDGDGFDDAVLGDRLVRGAEAGLAPEAAWLACPPAGCGDRAGDLDDDGYADLHTKDGLQFGSPTGFRSVATTLFDGAGRVRAAPDLDGDGVNDLVVLSNDHSKLSVVRGGSQGPTLGATASIRPPKDAAVDLAVGDIEGDGRSDIVLLISEKSEGRQSVLRTTVIVRSTPSGGDIARSVERRVTWSTSSNEGPDMLSASLRIADVNGDGRDDVVVFFTGPHIAHARVVLGSPGPLHVGRAVGASSAGDTFGTELLSLGDINGDGHDDVLIGSRPSIGFVESFDIYQGAAQGLIARPLARYSMSTDARVAGRRDPWVEKATD